MVKYEIALGQEKVAWEAEVERGKQRRAEFKQTLLARVANISPNLVGRVLDDLVVYERCVERLKKATEVFLRDFSLISTKRMT